VLDLVVVHLATQHAVVPTLQESGFVQETWSSPPGRWYLLWTAKIFIGHKLPYSSFIGVPVDLAMGSRPPLVRRPSCVVYPAWHHSARKGPGPRGGGMAHTREAKGTPTDSIAQTHLRPPPFTKVSWVERTGSR
jgi:hypothetical protein